MLLHAAREMILFRFLSNSCILATLSNDCDIKHNIILNIIKTCKECAAEASTGSNFFIVLEKIILETELSWLGAEQIALN